jgi:hypothetical protein
LERAHYAQKRGDFLKRERGELLEDLERRFCTGNKGDFPQRNHLAISAIAGLISHRGEGRTICDAEATQGTVRFVVGLTTLFLWCVEA